MSSPLEISAIILAAGVSRRMGGRDKLFLEIAGKPILQHAVDNALACRLHEVVVIAGEHTAKVRKLLERSKARVVENKQYMEGMSASLRVGVAAVADRAEGVLVLLGDQPNLRPGTLNRFVEIFWEGKKKIVAARYGGVIGNPVLFHREFFPHLQRLQGDTGARSLLQRFSENMAAIDIPAEEAVDVDTPTDFERLQ